MDSLPEITQPSDVVTKLTNSLEGLFMQAKSALEYGTHTADEKMRVIAAASKTVIALSKELEAVQKSLSETQRRNIESSLAKYAMNLSQLISDYCS